MRCVVFNVSIPLFIFFRTISDILEKLCKIFLLQKFSKTLKSSNLVSIHIKVGKTATFSAIINWRFFGALYKKVWWKSWDIVLNLKCLGTCGHFFSFSFLSKLTPLFLGGLVNTPAKDTANQSQAMPWRHVKLRDKALIVKHVPVGHFKKCTKVVIAWALLRLELGNSYNTNINFSKSFDVFVTSLFPTALSPSFMFYAHQPCDLFTRVCRVWRESFRELLENAPDREGKCLA